jgi:hypothetical protein
MESNRCEYKRELSDGLERKPLGLGRTGLTYFEAQVEVQGVQFEKDGHTRYG